MPDNMPRELTAEELAMTDNNSVFETKTGEAAPSLPLPERDTASTVPYLDEAMPTMEPEGEALQEEGEALQEEGEASDVEPLRSFEVEVPWAPAEVEPGISSLSAPLEPSEEPPAVEPEHMDASPLAKTRKGKKKGK
ncbi:MAG: hypothetical protein QNK37_11275 [Acidobacteriota bacterium]|nr:hypothetical protein [Acidobacteriota bacterium]